MAIVDPVDLVVENDLLLYSNVDRHDDPLKCSWCRAKANDDDMTAWDAIARKFWKDLVAEGKRVTYNALNCNHRKLQGEKQKSRGKGNPPRRRRNQKDATASRRLFSNKPLSLSRDSPFSLHADRPLMLVEDCAPPHHGAKTNASTPRVQRKSGTADITRAVVKGNRDAFQQQRDTPTKKRTIPPFKHCASLFWEVLENVNNKAIDNDPPAVFLSHLLEPQSKEAKDLKRQWTSCYPNSTNRFQFKVSN